MRSLYDSLEFDHVINDLDQPENLLIQHIVLSCTPITLHFTVEILYGAYMINQKSYKTCCLLLPDLYARTLEQHKFRG